MAFSRGRGRGGSRGSSRGGSRGSSRGGRGNSRGGRGGRGNATSAKLARSGIRTRAGYRKFDSQRVKDVEEESEGKEQQQEEDSASDVSEEEVDDVVPVVKAYNALLQGFKEDGDEDGGRRKRRKVEVEEKEEEEVLENEGPDDESGSEESEEDVAGVVEDDDDALDPYEAHFANMDDNELSQRLKSVQANEWRTEKQPLQGIGNMTLSMPQNVNGSTLRQPASRSTLQLPLKKRLADSIAKKLPTLDNIQQTLAPYIFNYSDTLIANRTVSNAASLRSLACLHTLNHILKGRDKVLKNSARLAASSEPETLDLRDQGFTRPKVLILTETRQMAYNYGQTIIDLFQPEQVENRQRFTDSFSAPIDEASPMPEDYRELFAGNNDNSFLTAMKFTRKTLKFFSAFYASDIILASPLGLRRIIENEDKKKADHDFLSSIEVVVVDQADAMAMQSWENITTVFSHLNLQPTESHGADFNRVRSFYLDGHAKFLRQTIVFSAYATPEMNRLFNSSMQNITGKAKLLPTYDGVLTSPALAGLGVKQTFSRFDSPTPSGDPDARFRCFTSAVLPSLLRLPRPADGAQGVLVFIPSYFDFIRVRNFFAASTLTENISFGAIHDYSSVPEQRRARSHFLNGKHSFLLYTQRAHHFFRLKVRGVKRVVFYGVPENERFYEEMVGGYLGTSVEEGRWEGGGMERVVGGQRVRGMLGGVGDTFDFV
ncbi:rRNA-binding ribosome biosynthesis protein utp25 [Elasticomyces elasticus]|uniref:U3 small nucleolar RNA-associated protein 25 n=1 Tax=Elasticomyces elasticus TaxID=574655 RepID=A0AAN7WC03_9PEZI|nr:rRNA-binding ribosome biosynthesis protein utp25 [Elasticomyces elasticus]